MSMKLPNARETTAAFVMAAVMGVFSACGGGSSTPALNAAPAATSVVGAASGPVAVASLMPSVNRAAIPASTTTAYATDRVQDTTEIAPDSDIGAFRTTCDFSHMAFDDPIAFPGQPGKSHLHAFFGNTMTDANSTTTSLHTTGNSTCRGGTVNRTAYWVPAMIDTHDGTPQKPLSASVYYKTGYNGVRPEDVKPFPPGLRMIAGSPAASTPFAGAGRFNCDTAPGVNSGWAGTIPDCMPSTGLLQNIDFPQCWDGVNLDSPDHMSHMAYANSSFITQAQLDAQIAAGNGPKQWWQTLTTTVACPPTHLVALPLISMGVWYQTPATAHEVLRWRLSSDNYDPSLPPGYSIHADWFNGWKPDIMNAWVAHCDNAKKDCHSHLLGDGRMIY